MKTNTTIKLIGVALAIAVLLFGAIGITGAAAQSAIPGDALYGVKTTIENTRLSLAQDAGDRAQMKLAFAEQRLTEIRGLIREGRYREIREAVLAFEGSINSAIMEMEIVSASDPVRAAAIAKEVTSALTRYAQTLSDLAAMAPDSIKPEVTRALDTTHIASGLGRSAGNENANTNDNSGTNSNSNNTADDNGNSNRNANNNGNGNVNGNAGDDNVNRNGNDNTNRNGNDNTNRNSDDNANRNGNDDSGNENRNATNNDDNSNDNRNDDNRNDNSANDNGNDDNGGSRSNDNSNTNGNDNDDDNGNDDDDDDDDD